MEQTVWRGYNTIDTSGDGVQWSLIADCLTDYEEAEKGGFTTLLVTRIHYQDEYNEIRTWFDERVHPEDWLPMEDETLEASAYLFKDPNLALEFRMRWS